MKQSGVQGATVDKAEVQALLAGNNMYSPTLQGLQRLADWGTVIQKAIQCATSLNPDARALLTRDECAAVLHYVRLMES